MAAVSSKKSGRWFDQSTWSGGRIPAHGDEVTIGNHVVQVDGESVDAVDTVVVHGTLRFSAEHNTRLTLDTLFVHGTLEIGTLEKPISSDKVARIIILPGKALDKAQTRRGVMVMRQGTMICHGASKRGYAVLQERTAQVGDTSILLPSAPNSWSIGDQIVIAGTSATGEGDELRVITAINGANVHFTQPLKFTHRAEEGFDIHVANITRNVRFESGDITSIPKRGHVMSMTPRTFIQNCGFYNLGRTDKSKKPNARNNVVGRYGMHLHRTGVDKRVDPCIIHGCAFVGAPGVAFTHHSSHANVTDNVAYNNYGSAFFAEAGDEIGLWENNLSIKTLGTQGGWYTRGNDFGHSGHGFWLQSPGVHVVGNIATGSADAGFGFITRGLKEKGLGQRQFVTANIEPPEDRVVAKNKPTVSCERVPLQKFADNIAYGCMIGCRIDLNLPKFNRANAPVRSTVHNLQTFACDRAMMIHYSKHIQLTGCRFVGAQGLQYGWQCNGSSNFITYRNLTVLGYDVAMREKYRSDFLPRVRGDVVAANGTFQQVRNGAPRRV